MALINSFYASFIASLLSIISLGLILVYILFFDEDVDEEEILEA